MLSSTYTTVGRTQTATFTATSNSGVEYSKFVSDLIIDIECNNKIVNNVNSLRAIADKYPHSLNFTGHTAVVTWNVGSGDTTHTIQLHLKRVYTRAKSQCGAPRDTLRDHRPLKRPRTNDDEVPLHGPFTPPSDVPATDWGSLGLPFSGVPLYSPFATEWDSDAVRYTTYDERIRENEKLIAKLQREIDELKHKVNG